jgi:hypothetical protein
MSQRFTNVCTKQVIKFETRFFSTDEKNLLSDTHDCMKHPFRRHLGFSQLLLTFLVQSLRPVSVAPAIETQLMRLLQKFRDSTNIATKPDCLGAHI